MLELKDSAGDQIASFNSTLPAARKQISRLTKMVQTAVRHYELRRGSTCPDERDCFYLVRTRNKDQAACRLSVVQGTFFETIPNQELLKLLWKDLLDDQAGVPTAQHREILNSLAKLERDQIAQSRAIARAAVKPRLRIMSEIAADANPHRYSEIEGHTVNLILKAPREDSDSGISQWVTDQFSADNLRAQFVSGSTMTISDEDHSIQCRVVTIKHVLNGLHIVVQAKLLLHAYS